MEPWSLKVVPPSRRLSRGRLAHALGRIDPARDDRPMLHKTALPRHTLLMLQIAKTAWESMRRHGEQTYPHECCGVLLGKPAANGERVVLEAVACRNARTDSPQNRYSIDPRDLIRIQLDSREEGLEILGFYHSHPDHPAETSPTDLEEAYWFGCSYVVTSVVNRLAADTRSFMLRGQDDDKQFEEEPVRIAEASGERARK